MRMQGLTYSIRLAAVAGLVLVTSTYTAEPTEAFADTDDQTITLSCAAGSLATYAPDITYTLVIAAQGANYSSSLADFVTISDVFLTGAVNGDSAPNMTKADVAPAQGAVAIYYEAPTLKLAGLTCSTGVNDSSTLEVQETTADAGDSLTSRFSKTFNEGIQDIIGVKNDMFGSNGPIGFPAKISDDSDATTGDGTLDGEIVFGHGSSKGGFYLYNRVQVSNFYSSGQAAQQVLTYTFTAIP